VQSAKLFYGHLNAAITKRKHAMLSEVGGGSSSNATQQDSDA
jgi:hypothetical protein